MVKYFNLEQSTLILTKKEQIFDKSKYNKNQKIKKNYNNLFSHSIIVYFVILQYISTI